MMLDPFGEEPATVNGDLFQVGQNKKKKKDLCFGIEATGLGCCLLSKKLLQLYVLMRYSSGDRDVSMIGKRNPPPVTTTGLFEFDR